MKKLLLLVALLLTFGTFAQTSKDSLDLKKLKEEIKKELREEMSAELKKQNTPQNTPLINLNGFTFNGYGVMNYYSYDYDTDKNLKNQMDAERLNFYIGYKYNDWISFQSEIEFEHG